MEAMKSIPTISQIMKLTHHNSNLNVFEFLKSQGYFNLLDLEQKYYLFVEACEYDSIDIAMLIFSTSINICSKTFLSGLQALFVFSQTV